MLPTLIGAVYDWIPATKYSYHSMESRGRTRGKMINKAEATKLFEDNACLIKDRDVIFERVARKLLGDDAVAFAKKQPNTHFNGYGIGCYTAWYLTQKGFFLAITYLNVKEEMRENGEEKG